jgi:hypothetical protein
MTSTLILFVNWLQANKEERKPEDMLPAELDLQIAKFYVSGRKDSIAKRKVAISTSRRRLLAFYL